MDGLKRLEVYGSRVDDFKFYSNLGLDEIVSALSKSLIGHRWHKREKGSYDYVYGEMDYGTHVVIRHDLNQNAIATTTYKLKLHTSCNTEELSEMLSKVPKIIANLGSL